MAWVRSAAVASFSLRQAVGAFLFVLSLFAVGCHRKLPPMVDVFEVGPRSVERHERIEIRGAGFPPGRRAEVSFRGTMHAPGERPASVEITTEGKVTSDETIAVLFDEVLEHRFAARGGALRHGTFHGSVEVRFTALGGAPVHGSHDAIELDVRPKAQLDPDADERGRQTLAKLGATLADDDALLLGELAPGGVAEQYGLLPGDRLVEFAGVRVHGPSDVSDQNVPRPLSLRYLRAGEPEERVVSIEAPPFDRLLPAWLTFGVLGFGVVSLAAALFASRRLTRVRRWEIALGAMLRDQVSSVAPGPRRPRPVLAAWLPSAALAIAIALVPLVPACAELDVPTLFVAWLAARIVLVRPHRTSTRRALGVLSWLVEAFTRVVPLSAVVVLGVHQTAALRALDISAAQGSWRWLALQAPWMTLATFATMAAASDAGSKRSIVHRLADTLGVALIVLVALGAWEPVRNAGAVRWLVPVAFLCKLVVVVALQRGLGAWSQRAGSRLRGEHASGAAAAVALLAVAGHFVVGTPGWLAEWLAPSLLVLTTVLVAVVLARALGVPPGPADELDPA